GTLPGQLAAPLPAGHHHPDAGDPRGQGLPGAGRGGAAAVVGADHAARRAARREVPVLPDRKPLDPDPRPRRGLVPGGAGGPPRPCARRALAAPRPPLPPPPWPRPRGRADLSRIFVTRTGTKRT